MLNRDEILQEAKRDKEDALARKREYNNSYFKDWYYNKGGKETRKKTREPRDIATRNENRRRHKKKDEIIKQMGGKCIDCNQSFHRNIYEFHHLDPNTKKEKQIRFGQSMEKIQQEIKKCVLLCANCHKMRHTERG